MYLQLTSSTAESKYDYLDRPLTFAYEA